MALEFTASKPTTTVASHQVDPRSGTGTEVPTRQSMHSMQSTAHPLAGKAPPRSNTVVPATPRRGATPQVLQPLSRLERLPTEHLHAIAEAAGAADVLADASPVLRSRITRNQEILHRVMHRLAESPSFRLLRAADHDYAKTMAWEYSPHLAPGSWLGPRAVPRLVVKSLRQDAEQRLRASAPGDDDATIDRRLEVACPPVIDMERAVTSLFATLIRLIGALPRTEGQGGSGALSIDPGPERRQAMHAIGEVITFFKALVPAFGNLGDVRAYGLMDHAPHHLFNRLLEYTEGELATILMGRRSDADNLGGQGILGLRDAQHDPLLARAAAKLPLPPMGAAENDEAFECMRDNRRREIAAREISRAAASRS